MRSLAFLAVLLVAVLGDGAPGWASADWAWPVSGQVLTQFRNGDDPYAAGQHRGVDIGAPAGTPVVAATAGTVEFAGVVGSSGLVVSERTGDGRYELSYLHLSGTSVHRGDVVARGDRVGAVGTSGTRSAEQPHLHFGVRESGDRHAYLDPLSFLAPPPARAPDPVPAPAPVAEPAPAAPANAPAAPANAPALAMPAAPGVPAVVPHAPGQAVHHAPHALTLPAPASALQTPPRHITAAGPHSARAPRAESLPHRAAAPAVAHAGEHGPAGSRPAPAAPVPRPRGPGHGGGVDIGWLAACAGLVLAAVLLAGPRSGGGRRPSARATFGALVRAASRT